MQSIYDNAYLANLSLEVLEQFHILAKLPFVVAYRFVSSHGNFVIQDEEWTALTTGLHNYPYYHKHLEELGLALEKLRAQKSKRNAVISSDAFRKSQLLQQERVHLGELSCELVVLASSCKGKEVICDPIDVNVKMEVPNAMDSMDLDYPEDVSLAFVPIPAAPALVPTKPAVVWQVDNRQFYHEVSGLKIWFFEPLVKLVPSDMIQTVIKCIIMQIGELLSAPSKKMIEQDFWALADGMVQGIFNELEEKLNHPSSEPVVGLPWLTDPSYIYKELCCLLNIGDLPLEPMTTSTVSPIDVWDGPSSESFPFKMKSDSTPDSLSNFVPSLNTTSLPSTLVEPCNISPIVIFSSGYPNAYFVCTGEDPLTYLLVKKNEEELVDPSLHMALTLQDIQEQMEIKHVEDLYGWELGEVFGIPFDV
ncbi:hypothetical protein GYMLUDRAFT_247571 [Collybiopsis luxurians FD-317 M1]|uniref:Uncharacterized protein n=1 Tax=Collybiopsis luxurians FD-317 M1 TaxID=944289 RepID=A0A0D0C365_9AGAR|nr:hypothetical protein GYMLUDRAFT_247571 [Collybiopsis luxurians FD-317 M1]